MKTQTVTFLLVLVSLVLSIGIAVGQGFRAAEKDPLRKGILPGRHHFVQDGQAEPQRHPRENNGKPIDATGRAWGIQVGIERAELTSRPLSQGVELINGQKVAIQIDVVFVRSAAPLEAERVERMQ